MQARRRWRGWDRLRRAPFERQRRRGGAERQQGPGTSDDERGDALVFGIPTSCIKSLIFQGERGLLDVAGNLLPSSKARAQFR